jgi:hypothetical protein
MERATISVKRDLVLQRAGHAALLSPYTNDQVVGTLTSPPFVTNLGLLPVGARAAFNHGQPAPDRPGGTSSTTMSSPFSTTHCGHPDQSDRRIDGHDRAGVDRGGNGFAGRRLLSATSNSLRWPVASVRMASPPVSLILARRRATTGMRSPPIRWVESYSRTTGITSVPGPRLEQQLCQCHSAERPDSDHHGKRRGNKEPGEPNHGGSSGGASVWWEPDGAR